MEHVLFECVNINLTKARRKFEEGYSIYVNTFMYKPLPLKAQEILNVELQYHTMDVERATSLIIYALLSKVSIIGLSLKIMKVDILRANQPFLKWCLLLLLT